MGAEQSLIGGRKRSRSVDNQTFEAYKAVRTMLEEQGKDFENQVFLDLPDARVLKRLGIFEDCDIFDDIDCKNSIKNIVIEAHGSLVERKEEPKEDDPPLYVTVPENIVVLFMGELGYVTWARRDKNITKDICNKELVPNQIGLPGSTIPNVGLSAEYKENHTYSSGIFDCDLNNNDIVNQFEGLEHYLIPTEEKVIDSMDDEVKEMLKKAKQKGEKIIDDVTLDKILPKISEKIPKDKYGFVYVFSCLGVCTKWSTQQEIEVYTKPSGLSPVRGYTIKKIPARIDVSRYSLSDGSKWNPVLTNDKDIITARNLIAIDYYDSNIKDETFINTLNWNAFNFDENWRNHLPDIYSDFIQDNKNKLRKSAYVNHFKFIDLLHKGDLEKIKNSWNMQFEDKSKFLLPRVKYYIYSKERNLNQKIENFKDNEEIFENIYEIKFESPENKIKNLIKNRDLKGLKKFIFEFMKEGVDGYKDAKHFEYEFPYNENDKDNEDVKKALKILEFHDIYNYTVIFEDLAREDDYYIKNKDEMKNTLDIKPYIDYVNSDEYVHPEKETTIENMNKINRKFFGFITEKEEKIMKLFEENDIKTAKELMFDYMKQGADDVDTWYIYERLRDDNYSETIQDMAYMHWNYDDLIRNGEESGIEDFIDSVEPQYRDALDIEPYIDYVNSDKYDHPEKEFVITTMERLKNVLGFTDVQQTAQFGQGRVQQYGGMWQRGGFFMTCS